MVLHVILQNGVLCVYLGGELIQLVPCMAHLVICLLELSLHLPHPLQALLHLTLVKKNLKKLKKKN